MEEKPFIKSFMPELVYKSTTPARKSASRVLQARWIQTTSIGNIFIDIMCDDFLELKIRRQSLPKIGPSAALLSYSKEERIPSKLFSGGMSLSKSLAWTQHSYFGVP